MHSNIASCNATLLYETGEVLILLFCYSTLFHSIPFQSLFYSSDYIHPHFQASDSLYTCIEGVGFLFMNWLKLLLMEDFLQNFWYNKEHCNGLLACTNYDEYNIVIYHDTWNQYHIITIFLISLSSIVIYQLSDILIIGSFIFSYWPCNLQENTAVFHLLITWHPFVLSYSCDISEPCSELFSLLFIQYRILLL